MKYIKFILFAFLIVPLQADNFSKAVESYDNGNYIKALSGFCALAKKDDSKAQYNVGHMYANSYGAKKDMMRAQYWYEAAAKQGNGLASYNLALLYHQTASEDVNAYKKARYWYEKAAEQDIHQAQNNLGVLYLEGHGVKKDTSKALSYFESSAKNGNVDAKLNAALMYAWGAEIEHDKLKAYEYLRYAVKHGKREAGKYLDKLCQESSWVCKN